MTGQDYPQKREDFDDELYKDLLDFIYKKFVEIYKNKCLQIENDVFKGKEPKEQEYRFSVGNNEYRINVTVDFEDEKNRFKTPQERGEYLMRIIVSEISIFYIDQYWQKHLEFITNVLFQM